MSSIVRYLPLAATLIVAPLTFAWGAEMMPAQTPARSGGLVVARAKDGLFYVDATVNGRKVRFLVDTGANVMMLTARDAALVGIGNADQRYGARVATAGGSAPMAWTRLASVELAGRQVTDVRAGVVDRGLEVSLLGQNMLSRLTSVTISGDTLRME